jgi:hypothetical protein
VSAAAVPSDGVEVSVAAHPRGSSSVRSVKGWCGLLGFLAALGLSLRAGVPVDVALQRALIAGAVLMLIGWGLAVAVWRHVIVADARARHDALLARAQAAQAEAAAATPTGRRR